MDQRRIFLSLGYAGLLPFLLPVVLILSQTGEAALWQHLAQSYAFAIICFLTGTWWGLALNSKSRSTLIVSNLIFLLAFAGFIFLNQYWTVISALLLISILIIEQYSRIVQGLAEEYLRMRCILSSIAGSAMLTLHGIS